MITFQELLIGKGGETSCRLCARKIDEGVPAPLSDIEQRITEIVSQSEEATSLSVMMTGFEPFMHPDLVQIVSALTHAGVRQIGMRTNGRALGNPQAAQGCIDAGVRVFEIPFFAGSAELSDRLSGIPGLFQTSQAGVKQVIESSSNLQVKTFVSALIPLCSHNRDELILATQTALAVGVQAIRIQAAIPGRIDPAALDAAHTLATRSGVAFFGDACDAYIKGASLYEVIV